MKKSKLKRNGKVIKIFTVDTLYPLERFSCIGFIGTKCQQKYTVVKFTETDFEKFLLTAPDGVFGIYRKYVENGIVRYVVVCERKAYCCFKHQKTNRL